MPLKTKTVKRGENEGLRVELAQYALADAFRKLVARAHRRGVAVVVDSDAIAIRLMPAAVAAGGGNLRDVGDVIRVDNACGGGSSRLDPLHGAS